MARYKIVKKGKGTHKLVRKRKTYRERIMKATPKDRQV